MTDFPMSLDMESLFINPTMIATDQDRPSPRNSRVSNMQSTMTLPHENFAMRLEKNNNNKKGKQRAKSPPASIASLFANSQAYLSGARGYTSEEEIASPIEADDFSSIQSGSESGELSGDASDVSVPEQLASTCNEVQHRWHKARAIQMTKAPKPRMISVPKISESPTGLRMKRPAPASNSSVPTSRATSFQSSRYPGMQSSTHTPSQRASANSSATDFSQPTPLRKPATRQPSTPLFIAAGRQQSQTIGTPSKQQSKNTSRDHSTELSRNDETTASHNADNWPLPATTPNKLNKMASSFSLHKFGRKKTINRMRHNSASSFSNASNDADDDEDESNAAYDANVPYRTTSLPAQKSKMVARGAGERAAPIRLPTCPDEGPYTYASYSSPTPSGSSGVEPYSFDALYDDFGGGRYPTHHHHHQEHLQPPQATLAQG